MTTVDKPRVIQAHQLDLAPSQLYRGGRMRMDWVLATPSLVLADHLQPKFCRVVGLMVCLRGGDESLRRMWPRILVAHPLVKYENGFSSTSSGMKSTNGPYCGHRLTKRTLPFSWLTNCHHPSPSRWYIIGRPCNCKSYMKKGER